MQITPMTVRTVNQTRMIGPKKAAYPGGSAPLHGEKADQNDDR